MSVITQVGDTALMDAAWWGRTEVVSLLLEAGANIDLQNKVNKLDRENGSWGSWVCSIHNIPSSKAFMEIFYRSLLLHYRFIFVLFEWNT